MRFETCRSMDATLTRSAIAALAAWPIAGFAQEPPPVSALPVASVASPTSPAPLPPASPLPAAAAPTDQVVMNLIRLMVQQHLITSEQADGLIRQAVQQAEAQQRAAAPPAPVVAAAPPAAVPGAPIHVQYVPEIVKQQLREEIKQEVLQTAKDQNWAQPNALPEWVQRIRVFGDFRLRYERDQFDRKNYNGFVDYNTINTGSGYDINPANTSLPPLLDTNEDRERLRVRARLGAVADLGDDFNAGVRLSTGTIANPISPNQTLGTDFNKFAVTVDRAYLKWAPVDGLLLTAGRFDNPFFTSDLVWYDEIGLDGIAVSYQAEVAPGVTPFVQAGAFPVENTALDFASTSLDKTPSRDKWLYVAEAGATWKATPDLTAKFGATYYRYADIAGEESGPCVILASTDSCDSDLTRAGFLTKGNSVFAIRDLVVNPANLNAAEPEFFGLASDFDVLELREQLDLAAWDDVHVILDGDYAINLGFDKRKVLARNPTNAYGGDIGNEAFLGRVTVGYPKIEQRWQWNVALGYKYLESDSVLDAFTDPDFHLGGTNAKGYTLVGNLGLGRAVWLSTRYFSATEVSGPPLAIDTLELDLNAHF